MIPSGWGTFLAFFLFVAPGIIYDLQRSKKQAHFPESTFREGSRIVLISTVCSLIAGTITLAALSAIQTTGLGTYLPSARDLVKGSDDLVNKIPGTAVVIVFFTLLSIGIAWFIENKQRSGPSGNIMSQSVWTAVFRKDAPRSSHVIARIKLQNGTSWSGKIAHFSPDLEMSEREIALAPPIEMKAPGSEPFHLQGWSRIILPANQIESISVKYEAGRPESDN